jgi:purine-binding chemotaxis protein CheW
MNSVDTKPDEIAKPESEILTFLCLRVGDELYGVGLGDIHEVLKDVATVRLPFAKRSVLGLANIRGRPVAIVDLRASFFGKEAEPSPFIAICDSDGDCVGLGVDAIEEVFTAKLSEIRVDPNVKMSCGIKNILGMVEKSGRLVRILDVKRWLSTEAFV